MSRLVVALVLAGCWFVQAEPAGAHVLIRDRSGSIGAILHITPDDDPVAGESSSIFFDIQGSGFAEHGHNVLLQVTDDDGKTVGAITHLTGSTVAASYNFPRQGIYKLTLTAEAQQDRRTATGLPHRHVFVHSQRVARGISNSPLDAPSHAWAEIGLVASLSGLIVLGIIANNRRKDIVRYSH